MEICDPFDPKGRIKGFQFVKKRAADVLTKTTERLEGTNKDLRKMTKEAAVTLLVDLCAGSIPLEQIVRMGRWERVREIATLSKKALIMGTGQELHKFARNVKSNWTDTNPEEFKKYRADW
jgi:hypothetical protein